MKMKDVQKTVLQDSEQCEEKEQSDPKVEALVTELIGRVADKWKMVSDAWINFARHGDPNHSGLPKWPAFNAEAGPVMIFDKTCEVKNDPDREPRKAVALALG